MTTAGFEPANLKGTELKSGAFDRFAKSSFDYQFIITRSIFFRYI